MNKVGRGLTVIHGEWRVTQSPLLHYTGVKKQHTKYNGLSSVWNQGTGTGGRTNTQVYGKDRFLKKKKTSSKNYVWKGSVM